MNILILCNKFTIIGGAENYVISKAIWLLKNNHKVLLIIFNEISDYYIKLLSTNNIPFLWVRKIFTNPKCYKEKQRECIIYMMEDYCRRNYKYIDFIESHGDYTMLWGELLAQRLRTSNITYFLAPNSVKHYKSFVKQKVITKQLLGCESELLPKIFEKAGINSGYNNYINIPLKEPLKVKIPYSYELKKYGVINIEKYDYIISTMSRFDRGKKYLFDFLKGVEELAILKKNKKMLVILVGNGMYMKELKKIAFKIGNICNNITIIFTGTIKPVPLWLFKISDIFVGMGTSVLHSASLGCSTVLADPSSNFSSGIFGIDSENFAYSNKHVKYSKVMNDLLEDEKLKLLSRIKAKNCFLNNFEEDKINKKFIDYAINNKSYHYASLNKLDGLDLIIYRLSKIIGLKIADNLTKKIAAAIIHIIEKNKKYLIFYK